MKISKIAALGIGGISLFALSTSAFANDASLKEGTIFPTISAVLDESLTTINTMFGEGKIISIDNLIKNIEEITTGKNTIEYRVKTPNEHFSFDGEKKELKLSEQTPSGTHSLQMEVCSVGKMEEDLGEEIPVLFIDILPYS